MRFPGARPADARRIALLGALLLVGALFLAFWPVIFRHQSLLPAMSGVLPAQPGPKFMLDPMAPAWFSYPLGVLANRIWEQGRLPLWNPFSSCGEPLLAGVHAGITSPLRFWLYFTPPSPGIWDAYCLLRLLLAGSGALWLGITLGIGTAGAFACGMAYMLSGFLVVNISISMLDAEAVLPWLVAGIVTFMKGPTPAGWAVCGLAAGTMLLLGNPQVALVDGVFAVALAAVCSWRLRTPVRMATISLAGLSALCLAGPALMPVIYFLPRAQHIHSGAGMTAIPLWGSVSLAAPWLLGRFGEAWAGINPFMFLPHAGLSVLILAVMGAGRTWRSLAGPAICLAPLVLLAATYGIPPVCWLGRLPGVSLLWWAKYQAPTYLCLAVLAGFGVENLVARVVGPRRESLLGWAVVAFLSAEMIMLVPVSRPAIHDPLSPAPYVDFLREQMDVAQERLYAVGSWLHPQTGAALGLPDVRSFYGMMPKRAYWYIRGLITGPAPDSHAALITGSSQAQPALSSSALSALSVRWIVLDDTVPPGEIPERLLERFRGGALVFENPDAQPRARLVERAMRVNGPEEALYRTSAEPVDRKCIYVEGPADWPGFLLRGPAGTVRVIKSESDEVVCKVYGNRASILLLADTWESGWKAFAGSRRINVLPANCMFRAVLVPSGESEVSFRYDPIPVKLGILGFGFSLALCLGFLAIGRVAE